MNLTTTSTPNAPEAIGPYSQAIQAQGYIFCSGQIGIDPATNTLVEGGIEAQTTQVLKNLTAVLEASNSSLNNVVKTDVFLADMSDFQAMNDIYASYFSTHKPARATVAVQALPKGALVEISCIATTNL